MGELITERVARHVRELKLLGLAETADELVDRAEAAKLGYREFLDLVLETEVGVLEGRRYASRLKLSGLPHHKTLEEFDASFQPQLDPKRLAELRSLRFIERRVCALLLGPPGVGKSHIAVGLAMDALRAGYLVRYTTLDDLIADLRAAERLGNLRQKLAQFQRPLVLVIDEWAICRWSPPTPTASSRSSTAATPARPRSSPPTSESPSGPHCSAMRSSPLPSSTGSFTTPRCSRLTAPPGAFVGARDPQRHRQRQRSPTARRAHPATQTRQLTDISWVGGARRQSATVGSGRGCDPSRLWLARGLAARARGLRPTWPRECVRFVRGQRHG